MEGFGIDFDFSKFAGKLDELEQAVMGAIYAGVWLAGEALRSDSVAIVPFQRGFAGGLAGSASTGKPEPESSSLIAAPVAYNKEYAARLHEDMTLNISQKFAGSQRRQQKYLEQPARENAQKYGRIINEHISQVLQ